MPHVLAGVLGGHAGVVAGVTVTAGVAAALLTALLAGFFLWKGGIGHYLIGVVSGAVLVLSLSTRIPHAVVKFISTANSTPLYIALGLLFVAGLALGFLKG